MIRETATRKNTSGIKGLLLIAAIAVFVIVLSSIIGMAEKYFGVNHLEYIIYVILLGMSYFLIQHYVTQYRYSLFDDELILEKMLGKRVTPVVNVFIWDILTFEKYNPSQKVKMADTFNMFAEKSNRWSITYKKNSEVYEAIFSPTEDFVAQLKSAIENRQHKEDREPDIIT